MNTIPRKQLIEVLTEARHLIANGWTQRTPARGKRGLRVSPFGRYACQFCAIGAMVRASKSLYCHEGASSTLVANLPGSWESIVRFNDDERTTQKMVLEAFDKAIQSLPGEQS